MEHSQDFSQIHSVGAGDVIDCLQGITTHERGEIVYLFFFCELIVDFWKSFGIDLQTVQTSVTFRQSGQCRCEQFWLFRDSVYVVVEVRGVAVVRQLLRGQQSLVCFNCGRGVLTAKLWLFC